MQRGALPLQLASTTSQDLYGIAAAHVRLAEESRNEHLWGRIGGSPAERKSARLLADQLRPFLPSVQLEKYEFAAHRPSSWKLRVPEILHLPSAMPAPFDAHFPNATQAPLVHLRPDADWTAGKAHWIFVDSEPGAFGGSNVVRQHALYQRAVQSQAAGLVFSLPMPADRTWKTVVTVDKPYALKDERYPNMRRPVPCFCVDGRDAAVLRAAAQKRSSLTASISYEATTRRESLNVIGRLPGGQGPVVAILTHIDAFFSGACDNATGIATIVGLARAIASVPQNKRHAEFLFVGLTAHHDCGAGMRAFVVRNERRFERIGELLLLEHTDAIDRDEDRHAGWTRPLNDGRIAYMGPGGWPEIRKALPSLVRQTGLMTRDPEMQDACVGDLFVTCGNVKGFSLVNSPPFCHTQHDTLDRISSAGLTAAVDFHIAVLRTIGAIAHA